MKKLSLAAALVTLCLGLVIGGRGHAAPATETAIFAGGCFWCVEHDLDAIAGVISVESGYTGGKEPNPTYEQVSSETTGHYEAVKVLFDPSKISYGQLIDRFWRLVDPTDGGGQFCDRGPSYRTAVFVKDAAQRKAAEASLARVQAGPLKGRAVTPIRDAAPFWRAEGYHQDYAEKNPLRYNVYRQGCGRDSRLRAVWGSTPAPK